MEHVKKAHGKKRVKIIEVNIDVEEEKKRRLEEKAIAEKVMLDETTCDICGQVYLKMNRLLEHKRVKHEGVRIKCLECGSVFSRNDSAIRHFRNRHNNMEVRTEIIKNPDQSQRLTILEL